MTKFSTLSKLAAENYAKSHKIGPDRTRSEAPSFAMAAYMVVDKKFAAKVVATADKHYGRHTKKTIELMMRQPFEIYHEWNWGTGDYMSKFFELARNVLDKETEGETQ